MTVKELTEKLSKLPPDAIVVLNFVDSGNLSELSEEPYVTPHATIDGKPVVIILDI